MISQHICIKFAKNAFTFKDKTSKNKQFYWILFELKLVLKYHVWST